ncbi:hybrid signal transduction histidine kinase L [Nasonia vitripennis]|uniref:Uncharacterized protein n=1 Tax=Nasonia vitripennis TaxID=7425 RepID=A0A7M7G6I3_NASVI|nr:hybrid signal transduction histidine kinase L [Nasonia vitripennis]
MDLVYIPEILTFGSFRSPQYRDYEQPWNKNYFDNGKTSSYYHHRQPQQQQQRESKDSCHLCKENKRRSLAAYIRGKTRNNSCSEICEEEEEVEEQQKQQKQEASSSGSAEPDSKSKKSPVTA